jgi:hypothetical protein
MAHGVNCHNIRGILCQRQTLFCKEMCMAPAQSDQLLEDGDVSNPSNNRLKVDTASSKASMFRVLETKSESAAQHGPHYLGHKARSEGRAQTI